MSRVTPPHQPLETGQEARRLSIPLDQTIREAMALYLVEIWGLKFGNNH
jgi:hypothetical protein